VARDTYIATAAILTSQAPRWGPTGVATLFRVLNHRPIPVLDAFKRHEQARRAD